MVGPAERHLGTVAAIARSLCRTSSHEVAAQEVARAVGSGDLACCVLAIDGDSARGLAIAAGEQSGTRLAGLTAARILDISLPIDGVGFLREVTRQRAAFVGAAGASEALGGRANIVRVHGPEAARLSDALVAAVPVECGADLVAVLVAWGDGCGEDTVPLLEAAAGMLALRWRVDVETASHGAEPARVAPPGSQEMRLAVARLLRDRPLRAALQPIVRLHDGAVMGWEALCRFEPTPLLRSPEDLFAAASGGLEQEVDIACLRAALAEAAYTYYAPLFLNVTVATLLDGDAADRLGQLVADANLTPSRVVLEISEREPVSDLALLAQAIATLRAGEYRIAVDDAGSGHASMRLIAELRPDFIKIDRSLIQQLANNRARRGLVVALLSFGGHIGSRVIAEGVETAEEQQALTELGVQYGQGWHLGMPAMVDPPAGSPDTVAVDPAWFAAQPVLGFVSLKPSSMLAMRLDTPKVPGPPRRGKRSLAQALSEAARALQSEHDRERILRVIADQLNSVIPLEEMVIYAADTERRAFVPLLATGPDAAAILADSFGIESGLTGWAFAQGVPRMVNNSTTHPLMRQIPGTPVIEESLLLLPLIAGDRKLGIINCYRRGAGRFRASELKAASLFAYMVAAAWRNAELYSELLDAAMTDQLTSLFNTRWLHEAGARELAQSARNGMSLAVLLLDLDHFKQVNDSCGHNAGDAVLRQVASCLRANTRRGDAAVRFGGEEFILLLPNTGVEGALRVADNIRAATRRLLVPPECPLRELTASIGIAVYPTHGDDLDALIRATDVALYQAKYAGRDRVVVASADAGRALFQHPRHHHGALEIAIPAAAII